MASSAVLPCEHLTGSAGLAVSCSVLEHGAYLLVWHRSQQAVENPQPGAHMHAVLHRHERLLDPVFDRVLNHGLHHALQHRD